MRYLDIDKFVNSYLATAAWVTCDYDECQDFTDEAIEDAKADCLRFIELVSEKFGGEKARVLLTVAGNDLDYLAPHDFFLTRNGHGAGFWDSPEKYGGQENADALTEIAQQIGECDIYHIDGIDSPLTF